MRIIYMGDQPSSSEGLRYLIKKNIDVVVVVAVPKDQPVYWHDRLVDVAHEYGLPTATDDELYEYLSKGGQIPQRRYVLENIDLVISFGFWKRIRKPLIELPRIGCINFHPAPLPDYRGMGGVYSFAIYENLSYWGVSAHFIDESFDTGDLIKVIKFDIDLENETAFSLKQKAHKLMVELFKEVLDTVCEKGSLPKMPQGKGRYIAKRDFETLRKVQPSDSIEEINRKIRAFWHPPYGGAALEIGGKEFTLVNEQLLKEIGEKYHQ